MVVSGVSKKYRAKVTKTDTGKVVTSGNSVKSKALVTKYGGQKKATNVSQIGSGDPNLRQRQQQQQGGVPTAYAEEQRQRSDQNIVVGDNEQNPKKSTDVFGDEVKRDAQGEYDLEQVKEKNVLEQFVRGVIAPTEQFVQMPKDIVEGVKSEDQVMKETGLDLLITPLIKPFVSATDRGVTDKEWYSPIGFFENESLPEFLNTNDDKRDFFTGMGDNLGIIGDVLGHDTTYYGEASIGAGYAHSADRFAQAPAYYTGSVVGEIPLWFVGVGEVAAAARISVKATAYTVRSGGKVANPVLLAKSYKVEKAVDKLATSNRLENKQRLDAGKKVATTAAVKEVAGILKKAYGQEINNIQKQQRLLQKEKASLEKRIPESEKAQLATSEKIARLKAVDSALKSNDQAIIGLKQSSTKLKTEYVDRANEINKMDSKKMIEYEGDTIPEKTVAKINFNAKIKNELLPEAQKFEKVYQDQVRIESKTELAGKIADKIEALPDIRKNINRLLTPIGRAAGDETLAKGVIKDPITRQLEKNAKAKKYDGPLGHIRYQKDALLGGVQSFVNSKYTGYGRQKKKYEEQAGIVSAMLSKYNVIDETELMRGKDVLDADIIRLEKEVVAGRLEAAESKAASKKHATKTDRQIEHGNISGFGGKEEDFGFNYSLGIYKPAPKDDSKAILAEVNLSAEKMAAKETQLDEMKKIQKERWEELSFVVNVTKDGQAQYVMNYPKLFEAIELIDPVAAPALIKKLEPKETVKTYRPSVSVTKTDGVIGGTGGDFDFIIRQMPKEQAVKTFGADTVGDSIQNVWRSRTIGFGKKRRKKTLIPKREQTVEILEMYKAADDVKASGGTKANVRPAYILPKGTSPKEIELIKHELYLENFDGSNFVPAAFADGSIVLQEKKLGGGNDRFVGGEYIPAEQFGAVKATAINEKRMQRELDVIDETDQMGVLDDAGDRKMTIAQIIENRKIAQNRYDENYFAEQQKNIDTIYKTDTGESVQKQMIAMDDTKGLAKASDELKAYKSKVAELEAKQKAVEETSALYRQLGMHAVGDPKGTVFSIPMAQARKAVTEERGRIANKKQPTWFKDKKTGRTYFRYAISDKQMTAYRQTASQQGLYFMPGRVDKEKVEVWDVTDVSVDGKPFNPLMVSDRSLIPTDRSKGGSASPAQTGWSMSERFPDTGLGGESFYGKLDDTVPYARQTREEQIITDAVRGKLVGEEPTAQWVPRKVKANKGRINLTRNVLSNPNKLGEIEEFTDFLYGARRLDPEETAKLLDGDRLGETLFDSIRDKKAVDQRKTTVDPTTGIATRSTKDVLTSKYKIKLQGQKTNLSKKLIEVKGMWDGDRFEVLKVTPDGKPELQPDFMFSQTDSIFGGARVTGLNNESAIGKIRTILATGDHPQITQGEIPAGLKVVPIYQMDSTFNIRPNNISPKLQKMEERLGTEEFNRLKENKLDTFDAMEAYAKSKGPAELQRFRTEVIRLWDQKTNPEAARYRTNEIKAIAKAAANPNQSSAAGSLTKGQDWIRIKHTVKNELLKTKKKARFIVGKTGKSKYIIPERDLKQWNKATGKSGLKIIFQKAGIRGRKTADYPLGRKINLDPEQAISVVPRTMNPFNPIASRWGGLKHLLQRKRAVEVEDADPRTREAIVEGYEALMRETGTKLKPQEQKNYDKWKGENQTSFEFALAGMNQKMNSVKEVTDPNKKTYPHTSNIYGKSFDDPDSGLVKDSERYGKLSEEDAAEEAAYWKKSNEAYKQKTEQEIIDNNPNTKFYYSERKGRFDSTFDESMTPAMQSDRDFKLTVKKAIFASHGNPVGLKGAKLQKSAEQISEFNRLLKKMSEKPGTRKDPSSATVDFNRFVNDAGGSGTVLKQPANEIKNQKRLWDTVKDSRAKRIDPDTREQFKAGAKKIEEQERQQQGSWFGGGGEIGAGGTMAGMLYADAQPMPQAYAEPNRMESISDTVRYTLDGVVTGGERIGVNTKQDVKLSNSPSGGILGVNTNLIPSQKMDESVNISTSAMSGLGQMVSAPQKMDSSFSPLVAQSNIIISGTNPMTTTVTGSQMRDMLYQNIKPIIGPFSFTSAATVQELRTVTAQKMAPVQQNPFGWQTVPKVVPGRPRVIPPVLPVIPLGSFGKPQVRRKQPRFKKKSGKAYWQTPQNWYEPYYWGGKDQMGSGYTVFKGKEPSKVRKYDQKWFGLDLGNLW